MGCPFYCPKPKYVFKYQERNHIPGHGSQQPGGNCWCSAGEYDQQWHNHVWSKASLFLKLTCYLLFYYKGPWIIKLSYIVTMVKVETNASVLLNYIV